MKVYNRLILTLLVFASVSGSLFLVMSFPSTYLFVAIFILLVLFNFLIAGFGVFGTIVKKSCILLWILSICGELIVFVFIAEKSLQNIAVILFGFITAAFWWFLSVISIYPEEYARKVLHFWEELVAVYCVFILTSVAFAMFVFFRFPAFLSSLIIAGLSSWLALHLTFSDSKNVKQDSRFWTIACIFAIVFELVWVLHFLPWGYFIDGVAVSSLFYIVIMLFNVKLLNKTLALKERNTIIILLACLVFSVIFARWI